MAGAPMGAMLVVLVWKTWRRPTFPRLGPQYHGRGRFSRSSSGWDRVWSLRHGHQVVQTKGAGSVAAWLGWGGGWRCVLGECCGGLGVNFWLRVGGLWPLLGCGLIGFGVSPVIIWPFY